MAELLIPRLLDSLTADATQATHALVPNRSMSAERGEQMLQGTPECANPDAVTSQLGSPSSDQAGDLRLKPSFRRSLT